jgi:iron uptake system EfeUOB component EfeO/EfeM
VRPEPTLDPVRGAYSEDYGRREGNGELADLQPIAPERFAAPITAYRRYAAGQVAPLRADAARLEAAISDGDRGAARAAWRDAFGHYLQLGAVYGAFAELDQAIAGRPGGLPQGEADPRFTGLHRLELGLWRGEPLASLRPLAARLRRDVGRLPAAIRREPITPLDYTTRAHEILEDAQRDFLSGTDIPGSGEGVLATAAGLTATNAVLRTLQPLLANREIGPAVRTGLDRLGGTLAWLRRRHGGRYPTLDALAGQERAQLNGSLGYALDRLAMLPDALETVDPPPVPRLP